MRRPLVILVVIILAVSTAIWWWGLSNHTSEPVAASRRVFPTATPLPTPTPVVVYQRPDLQTGIIFPQWSTEGYSAADANWGIGLQEIEHQTGARWIEMPINFFQDDYNSSTVQIDPSTPSPESVQQGIAAAHALGKHVFLVPVISLRHTSPWHNKWSGDIRCITVESCTAWFASYFQTYKPYLRIAQDSHVEQVAIGTELSNLEILRSDYWTSLINNISQIYTGRLTYDTNFTTLIAHAHDIPGWFANPKLNAIGVSSYFSVADTPTPVPLDKIPSLWAQHVRAPLDALSDSVGKPIIISEIGYRNNADALYNPFVASSTTPADPALQAAAYDATLQNIVRDSKIDGVYFWAWSVPPFAPNNLPAANVLHQWYTSPKA